MKRVFKIYMLLQLIMLPFAIAGMGKAFDSAGGGPENSNTPSISATADARSFLCDAVQGEVKNSIQDDIQQLRYITAELYGEDIAEECFTTPVAGAR